MPGSPPWDGSPSVAPDRTSRHRSTGYGNDVSYAPWVAADSGRLGYGPWVVVLRYESMVVGSAGFQGTPTDDGTIELGFGIREEFRKRGFATEAAASLLAWGFAQPSVRAVIATCERANTPSIRVLQQIGMSLVGEDERPMRWIADRGDR